MAGRATVARSAAAARRRRGTAREPRRFDWRLVRGGVSLGSIVLGIVAELGVLFGSGVLGEPLRQIASIVAGWAAPLLPFWVIGLGIIGLARTLRPELVMPSGRLWGMALATLALIGLLHLIPFGGPGGLQRAQEGQGGGLIGFALGSGLRDALGPAAALLLLCAALLLGVLLALNVTLSTAVRWSGGRLLRAAAWARACYAARRQRPRVQLPQARPRTRLPEGLAQLVRRVPRATRAATGDEPVPSANETPTPPPRGSESWRLPPISMLEAGGAVELSEVDVRQRARIIEETLASFNVEARVVEVNQGPSVTQFGIEPAAGVAVRRILALQNDIGLRLGAWPVRFEAPVPGKRVVGLEVPNQSVAVVSLRGLLESEEYARMRSRLKLALGRDVSGRAVVADLARMPHLLIAGATGSGKSVCINAILAALLFQNTPDELQFVMIDPKMVELMPYNGIPHLRMPVVTDMDQVVGTLKWVVREMERRYALFVQHAARNIESYNRAMAERAERPLPYLVVVIDELADMMMTAPDEVEILLCRLAQKARATGIHLIVATQRPSVDVLTGMIKANLPTRIAFAVSSQIDSRVILDTVGAEKLLGRGDMLFSSGDTAKPVRIQGAWVSDQELQRLVSHWRRQGLPRYTDDDVQEIQELSQSSEEESTDDDLYARAVDVANHYSRVSTSLLQRRLGIGYPRAARLMDLMEERGVIGPSADGKSREVLARAEAPSESG